LTSRRRRASAAASNVAAEVTGAMAEVHSISHVAAGLEDDNDSRAPEIIYRRRRKKLKKNISVAGDKQQKASSS